MAKKKSASKRAKAKDEPSKPPKPRRSKAPGGGGDDAAGAKGDCMDSAGGKKSAMLSPQDLEQRRQFFRSRLAPTKGAAQEESDLALIERQTKVQQKEAALKERELLLLEREQRCKAAEQSPPFPKHVSLLIRKAPNVRSLEALVSESLRRLRWFARGRGDSHHGYADNDAYLIGESLAAIADITRQFRQGLTTKTTPTWLLEIKDKPAFKRAWQKLEQKKGAHDKKPWPSTILESKPDSSGTWHRCEFKGFQYKLWRVWTEGEALQEEGRMTPTTGVLSQWVWWTIYEFDKWHARWPENYSRSFQERWTDEGKYLGDFMEQAEKDWNEEGVADIQIRAKGLLRTNSGGSKSAPRQEFRDFKKDVRRIAERQLHLWKKTID